MSVRSQHTIAAMTAARISMPPRLNADPVRLSKATGPMFVQRMRRAGANVRNAMRAKTTQIQRDRRTR